MITGQQPYAVDEADSRACTQAILEQVPRLPSKVAPPPHARRLRGDLDSILMKALRKSPSERYVSVARFSEASPDRAQGRDITVRAVLDAAAESLDGSSDGHFAESPLVAATIRRSIADVYLSLGMIDTAGPHIEWALDTLREQGQRESVDYIRALGLKSHWLGLRFEHERARSVAEEAFIISTRLLGDSHLLTLNALSALGVTHHMTGELEKGEAIFAAVYQRRAAILGEAHEQTIDSLRRLGTINHWLGDYTRAEWYYRQCVGRSTESLGSRHPLTLVCRSSLGSVLEVTGRYVEAEPVIRDHIVDARDVLGDNHIATLRSMHNLADVYRGLGQTEKSERLFRETLQRRREALGDAHVETLQTQMKLARVYRHPGVRVPVFSDIRQRFAAQSGGAGESLSTASAAAAGDYAGGPSVSADE